MGFASGLQAGTQFRQQREDEKQRQQLGQLSQQYQLGSPQDRQAILGQIAQYDPQQAQFLQQQQVAQQQQQQQKLQRAGQLANTVLKADPKNRAAIYKATLKAAEKYGMDVSDLPQEYTQEIDPYLQSLQGMSGTGGVKDRKVLEDIAGRKRYQDTGEYVFKDITQTESPEAQAKKEQALFDKATTLRKEFTATSKPFVVVRDAYNRIQASAQDPSPAGDLALIFNYMKVLDPGSTVREGEFATAENSAGVPDRVRAKFNKVLKGDRLAPEQRKDFVDRADKLYNVQLGSQKRLVKKFGDISKRAGVNKENVLLEFANETPEAQEALKEVEGQKEQQVQEGRTATNPQTGEKLIFKGGQWQPI